MIRRLKLKATSDDSINSLVKKKKKRRLNYIIKSSLYMYIMDFMPTLSIRIDTNILIYKIINPLSKVLMLNSFWFKNESEG